MDADDRRDARQTHRTSAYHSSRTSTEEAREPESAHPAMTAEELGKRYSTQRQRRRVSLDLDSSSDDDDNGNDSNHSNGADRADGDRAEKQDKTALSPIDITSSPGRPGAPSPLLHPDGNGSDNGNGDGNGRNAPGNDSAQHHAASTNSTEKRFVAPAAPAPGNSDGDSSGGGLLAYEREAFAELLAEDGLIVMSKGLGIERLVSAFVQLYCDREALVLVIGTSEEEQQSILEAMRTKAPRASSSGVDALCMPSVITNEQSAKERSDLYMKGGVFFITSRILIVDMLKKRIPVHLVTGILVQRAHKVIDTSTEAFILRLYRHGNKTGFVKGFSSSPEAFRPGFMRVEKVMKCLYVRKLYLWPRFHAIVGNTLEAHGPEVIQLGQPVSDAMKAIQHALVDIIDACIQEIKHSNPTIEVEHLTVENGLLGTFDYLIRQQLDPIWHRVGAKTKQLVSDITILRKLLVYLYEYDCVTFNTYLETLRTSTKAFGQFSLWLFLDAATTLFETSRERVYLHRNKPKRNGSLLQQSAGRKANPFLPNMSNEQARERFLADVEAREEDVVRSSASNKELADIELVLEENPKWELLLEILMEIDQTNNLPTAGRAISEGLLTVPAAKSSGKGSRSKIQAEDCESDESDESEQDAGSRRKIRDKKPKTAAKRSIAEDEDGRGEEARADPDSEQASRAQPPPNVALILVADERTANQLQEYMQLGGRAMLERLYRRQMAWKRDISQMSSEGVFNTSLPGSSEDGSGSPQARNASTLSPSGRGGFGGPSRGGSAALRRLAKLKEKTQQPGGAPSRSAAKPFIPGASHSEQPDIEEITHAVHSSLLYKDSDEQLAASSPFFKPGTPIVIHPISRMEEKRSLLQVLQAVDPIFVVVYDPEPWVARQLELFKALRPGVPLRVYFMIYDSSVEEQRYLTLLKNEKDAFLSLIREKAIMVIPVDQDGKHHFAQQEALAATEMQSEYGRVSSSSSSSTHLMFPSRKTNRYLPSASALEYGANDVSKGLVVVDVREFRSTLPSLLHQRGFEVEPVTLEIGDYVLSPQICVERKSVSDLIQSLNSGRLYAQVDNMTKYYQQPVLLIEFDENKSFALQSRADLTSEISLKNISSKLVLLTLHFPQLRILWCQSPYATAEMFETLKEDVEQPSVDAAVAKGTDDPSVTDADGHGHSASQDFLRKLAGVNAVNARAAIAKHLNIMEIMELSLPEMQETFGTLCGKQLHDFFNKDSKTR